MATIKAIVFDANETLLDLAALDPLLGRLYGDPRARTLWFRQVVELFLTTTVLGRFRPFSELADAALTMTAAQLGVAPPGRAERADVHAAMLELPAHPDVRPALQRLRETDLTLAVLTNSGSAAIKAQLRYAGVDDLFDAVLSADGPERYKPAAEAYAYAARKLRVDVAEVRLVAAHGWDVAGALAAGARAAFVARAGKALDPHAPAPDITGADLVDVARQIVREDG
jgi:2-haloacid dehalogenase